MESVRRNVPARMRVSRGLQRTNVTHVAFVSDDAEFTKWVDGDWQKYKDKKDKGERARKSDIVAYNQVGSRDELVRGVFWPEEIYKREKGEDLSI